jgi:hypothetical protein
MLILTLNDQSKFDIELNRNPVGQYIEKTFRHLQHLPVPFHIYDYLNYFIQNKELIYNTLIESAKKLNVDIDVAQLTNQLYLNSLHKLYELGYNKGSNVWLEYHEMIHSIEAINQIDVRDVSDEVIINFRDRAGPLEKPFNRKYLEYGVQSVTQGMCFCRWGELGKIPRYYWADGEPDDIERICQLAKPWTVLRPSFNIALEDMDFTLSAESRQGFNSWFAKHKQAWMQYWKLDSWTEDEMSCVIPIGQIKDVSSFVEKIHSGKFITKVSI